MRPPDPRQTAWDILTDNYGMVVRKWRSAWPRFREAMSRPEVMSVIIDAAAKRVTWWREDGGACLKTFVLESVYNSARKARERWVRDRQCGHLETWDRIAAPMPRVCDDDRLALLARLGSADRLLVETVVECDLNFAAAAERLGMPSHMVRRRFAGLTATVRGWAGRWEEKQAG